MKPVADTRKPYSGLTRSLVVAIDVGTTFSGVSYAILEPGEIPKIHGVTRFPGQEHVAGNSKIPSILYYDKQGQLKAAGAEADNAQVQAQAEDDNWTKVELFKLRLRPRTMHLSMNGLSLAPLPARKSPVHIFGDFLSYLYNCTTDFIRDTHANGSALLKSIIPEHLEFVLAHPNGWEGAQQAKMRRAAVYGGLVSDTPEGRAKIRFVTEGEASLHACVLSGLAADVLSNPSNHGFLIADAGGGTLDISSYAIKGTYPLVMEEIAPPDCVFAGSVFVSRRAREFFEQKLKGSQYGTSASLEHITKRFDETTKRLFRDRKDVQFVPFGSPFDKDPAVGIRAGQLRLTGAEVANLFEPSVDAAYNSIRKQIESCGGMIKSVFLVGGYAASPWLFSQLQARLGALNIVVSRPDTQTSKAVADGAIGFYCDHHVSARMSRFMYGVEYLRQLDPNDAEHLARQEKLCELPSGPKLLPDAFDCILARGVKVKESTVFTRKYCTELTSLSMLKVFEVEIWCYRGGNAIPKWIDRGVADFSTLCIVRADLSMLSDSAVPKMGRGGKNYWTIVFSVEIHFGLTEFRARIKWVQDGVTKYGPATIVYNERGHRGDEDEPDIYPEDDALTSSGTSRQNSVSSRPRTPIDGHFVDSSRRSTSSVAPSIRGPSNPPTPSRSHAALDKDRSSIRSATPSLVGDRPRSRASVAAPVSPGALDRQQSFQSARLSPRPPAPPTPVAEHVEPPSGSRRTSPLREPSVLLEPVASPAKAPSAVPSILEDNRPRSAFEETGPPKSIFGDDLKATFGTPDMLGRGRTDSLFDNGSVNPAFDTGRGSMSVFGEPTSAFPDDKNSGGLWGTPTNSAPPAVPGGWDSFGVAADPTPPPAPAEVVPPSPAISSKSKSSKKSPWGSPAISRANSSQGQSKPLSPLNPNATPATIAEVLETPAPAAEEPPAPANPASSPPRSVPTLTIPSTPNMRSPSVPATPAEDSSTPITPITPSKKKKKATTTKAKEKEAEAARKAEEEQKARDAAAAEEAQRKAQKEAARAAAEQEAQRIAQEEAARLATEEEAKRKTEEAARLAAEEEAKQKLEEEARIAEAKRIADEDARVAAEREAEEARLKAEHEAELKKLQEEEEKVKKEIEEMEKRVEQEEREKREKEKEKEAQVQPSSFGFGGSTSLFGGMGSTLGSSFLKPTSLFGSGSDDKEETGSGWGFGSKKSKSPPAETPKRTPSFNWGGSAAGDQTGNRDSTSLFGGAGNNPVFDSVVPPDGSKSPPPPATENKSPIPVPNPLSSQNEAGEGFSWGTQTKKLGMGGSQQPTRSSTPQPPVQPGLAPSSVLATPVEESTTTSPWGLGATTGKKKAKAPTDSLASEMEDNFEEALETPAGGDKLDDPWAQQNTNNEKTGVTPVQTPKPEKKDLVDLLDNTNAGDNGAGGAQEVNPEEEWGLPVKMKKKKGKKAGEDTDQDATTGAEGTTKKKKKGKK
ncbi:hypothetical protein BKA70DRAFT_1264772 [Coprinopsis sp. MPI-PUGE-AT-0042]|nr:hypothetical protein BKA70DRAFT_1264772 [Coprinopsis sp. MPI-PUGE-AT-0042]